MVLLVLCRQGEETTTAFELNRGLIGPRTSAGAERTENILAGYVQGLKGS